MNLQNLRIMIYTGQFLTGHLINIFKVVNKVTINDADILVCCTSSYLICIMSLSPDLNNDQSIKLIDYVNNFCRIQLFPCE